MHALALRVLPSHKSGTWPTAVLPIMTLLTSLPLPQVHYSPGRPAGDRPGFRLSLSPKPTPFTAGMLTYASKFAVPNGKPSHRVASSCCYAGFEPLHAMAFRVHTHELGRSESDLPHSMERLIVVCYAVFEPLRAMAFHVHTRALGRWEANQR